MRKLALLSIGLLLLGSSLVAAFPPPKPKRELPGQAVVRLSSGLDSSGNATHLHPVPFSPDGKTLAWADRKDHSIYLWDVRTHAEVANLRGHENFVLCLAYSPDGKAFASGSYDGSIRIWDLKTKRTLRVLQPSKSKSMVYSVAFSPDGKTLASGDYGGAVRLWEVATGELLRTHQAGAPVLKLPKRAFVQVVAFSPDGKTLVSGSKGAVVQFWDVATGKERVELRKVVLPKKQGNWARAYATSIDFSPDGTLLAASFYGTDQSIYVWDTATGKEAHKLIKPGSTYTVAFSADGKFLLSTSRRLRVWELASNKLALLIMEPRPFIYCMYSGSFSPDGKLLCSGGMDNGVMLWDAFGRSRNEGALAVNPRNLNRLWKALGDSDPAIAYPAIGQLVKMGGFGVNQLADRLRAVRKADPKQIAKWVRELDSDSFEEREHAEEQLATVGDLAERALRAGLENPPSAEFRLRARRLVKSLTPSSLASLRAIIVLERIDDSTSRKLLAELAKGDPRSPRTREARAARARLAGDEASRPNPER